jgi:hypothetical protein
MAKKGHVNDDVSDVPVEARAAPMNSFSATDGKGDGSVIIVAIFLVAVGQFSPMGAPNSRLLRRSGTRK